MTPRDVSCSIAARAAAALRRWCGPGKPTSGTVAIAASSITVTVAPTVRAASASSGTAAGSPEAPMIACCPGFQIPAFSVVIAASVSPRIA